MTNGEFTQVYLELRQDMLGTASKTLRVREDAEDVVQQTFCDLLEKLPDLDGARNVRAFIFCKLIWNLQALLQQRTREPIEPLPSEDEIADGYNLKDDPLAVVIDEGRRVDVDMALLALPEPQRAVVTSVIVTGRSFVETGKALWPGLEPYARRRMTSRLFNDGIKAMKDALRDYKP